MLFQRNNNDLKPCIYCSKEKDLYIPFALYKLHKILLPLSSLVIKEIISVELLNESRK